MLAVTKERSFGSCRMLARSALSTTLNAPRVVLSLSYHSLTMACCVVCEEMEGPGAVRAEHHRGRRAGALEGRRDVRHDAAAVHAERDELGRGGGRKGVRLSLVDPLSHAKLG